MVNRILTRVSSSFKEEKKISSTNGARGKVDIYMQKKETKRLSYTLNIPKMD